MPPKQRARTRWPDRLFFTSHGAEQGMQLGHGGVALFEGVDIGMREIEAACLGRAGAVSRLAIERHKRPAVTGLMGIQKSVVQRGAHSAAVLWAAPEIS